MKCHLSNKTPQLGGPRRPQAWYSEAWLKHDGYRLIVQRDGNRVRLFTRNGYDWSGRFPLITRFRRGAQF